MRDFPNRHEPLNIAEIGMLPYYHILISNYLLFSRWINQLDPSLNKNTWSEREELLFMQGHAQIGNRWADIAKLIGGR